MSEDTAQTRMSNAWQINQAMQELEQITPGKDFDVSQETLQRLMDPLYALRNACLTAPLSERSTPCP